MGVPPSGGSLEIGNRIEEIELNIFQMLVPPSGGPLEIGNFRSRNFVISPCGVPPSGGSLEIGNFNQMPA